MLEHVTVMVDVDDSHVGIVLLRQLVHISLGRQPWAYIYELASRSAA